MQFGTIMATHSHHGNTLRPPASPLLLDFLCDGGCRPNPGVSPPVVHDGSKFLAVPAQLAGTNQQAVYDAVDFALKRALHQGATEVRVSVMSRLVWGQLSGNHGVARLVARRDGTLALAAKFQKVTWLLISPPLSISGRTAKSLKTLRRLASLPMTSWPPLRRSASGPAGAPASAAASKPVIAVAGTANPVPARPGP